MSQFNFDPTTMLETLTEYVDRLGICVSKEAKERFQDFSLCMKHIKELTQRMNRMEHFYLDSDAASASVGVTLYELQSQAAKRMDEIQTSLLAQNRTLRDQVHVLEMKIEELQVDVNQLQKKVDSWQRQNETS